jgi:MFS transporter, FHS family, L-fucose permease
LLAKSFFNRTQNILTPFTLNHFMALDATMKQPQSTQALPSQNYFRPLMIIGMLFFVFGFVTWLNAVLIPYLKIACQLNDLESYLVAFAFYISYLVMAIPSAWVLKKTGFKKGMSVGLGVIAIGALIFIPAALTRTYMLFLLGLFVQGTGLAILQTAVNPYVTILGPLESAAKRISIMGIFNKIAGVIAPALLGFVVLQNADALVESLGSMTEAQINLELNALAERVIVPYLIIVTVLVILAISVLFSSLPEIDTDKEDNSVALATSTKTSILQFPHLILGMTSMFLYVGVEVLSVDTIISYGAYQGIPFTTATFFSSFTLGAMIVGYLIGIAAMPKYVSQENALAICAALGVLFSLGALFTTGTVSVLFISMLGLANAIMWPAIWPLALADLGRFTKIGSSLLIMGIAGGAVLPLVYGYLVGEFNSAQQAYWLLVPCYLFILYFSTAGHKVRT